MLSSQFSVRDNVWLDLFLSANTETFQQTTRFSICFNLPFFVVTTRDYEDSRILTGDRYLRARHDFSLLCLETLAPVAIQKGSPVFCSGAILHQAVYSLLVTGHNSNYWVAVCLDEDFSGKELRLAHGNKSENNHVHEDPITSEPCLKVTPSPQACSLTALTRQLEKIVKHHGQILECLTESLTIHVCYPMPSYYTEVHRDSMYLLSWLNHS
jgi:hypothetical protein